MAYQEFTWCPLIEPEGTHSFRTHSARFGDGYKQSVGDGINNESESWPVQFRGTKSYIVPIRDFLREHQGFKPFLWTPPLGEQGLYEASEFNLLAMGGGLYTLSTTFTQRFAP